MRSAYILYSDARKKLEEGGIMQKIRDAKKRGDISPQGHMYDDTVKGEIRAMKSEDLFDVIESLERKKFLDNLSRTWSERDNLSYKVQRENGTIEEQIEAEDFLLLSGAYAIPVLPKEDLFAYKKYGFLSLTDFTGSVGAAVHEAIHTYPDRGFTWGTRRPDGRIMQAAIAGNTHCDLHIHQENLTPYPTQDFLGVSVSYRPRQKADSRWLTSYHSTESELLVAILRWCDQVNIRPSALENRAEKFIAWTRSLGQGGGTCAEHFGATDGMGPSILFVSYKREIPQLDAEGCTSEHSLHSLPTTADNYRYVSYITSQKELGFAGEGSERYSNSKKKVGVSFMPGEADHLLHSLFWQAAHGLGRTSAKELIRVLEYRYSEQFVKDQERYG